MHYVQQPKEISKSLGNSDLDLWREVCARKREYTLVAKITHI